MYRSCRKCSWTKFLDKSSIEKEIEELGSNESKESEEQLSIAKAKLEAITVSFYDKI